MRKLLFSFAGLALGGYVALMPRSSTMPMAPQGAQADPVEASTRKEAPMPPSSGPSPYEVKAKDGAWMICAANYTGTDATYLATQVAHQLRGRKVNAFIFNYADKQRSEMQWTVHQQLRQRNDPSYRPRFTRIEGQTAVLIGGFKTMEDARAALPNVLKLDPPEVKFKDGTDASDRFVVFGEAHNPKTDREETKAIKGAVVNPFERSFVIRNPAVSQNQTARKNDVDPAWKSLNSEEPYSLLKNKKNYTLVVKVYTAGAQYQSGMNAKGNKNDFISKIGLGGSTKGPDILEATANQAHEVARFLRQYSKVDAYVLHMRHGSLVAVGGFKSLEDPELVAMSKKIGGLSLRPQGSFVSNGQSIDPTYDPFQLMLNPMPMRVPKL